MDKIDATMEVGAFAELPQQPIVSDADMILGQQSELGGKINPLQEAEAYLSKNYDFRRNVIIEKTEFKLKAEERFVAMTDRDYNSLYRKLQKTPGKISIATLRGLLNSDFVGTYNPFVDYVESLPKWDGHTDHILELARTVKTTNDEFWHECFKRWMVAYVGCATDDAITNHTVIVFAGKQGVGKTTWHLNLVPRELQGYKYSGIVKPHNKDSGIQLSECILINLDELESLNKAEIGDLKEMVTKSAIRVRRAYGYNHENYTRRASFTGSVNKAQFLNDTTGSRRFLCFEVLEIVYPDKRLLNLAMAQAKALLDSGLKFWFDDAEIAAITKNNERYQVLTVEEELLLKYFQPTGDGEKGHAYTATELAGVLTATTKISVSNTFVNNLGRALNKHRFKRVKANGVYSYLVRKLDSQISG
jgi:predicted P-loop ATPase